MGVDLIFSVIEDIEEIRYSSKYIPALYSKTSNNL